MAKTIKVKRKSRERPDMTEEKGKVVTAKEKREQDEWHCSFCKKPWGPKEFPSYIYPGRLPEMGKNYRFSKQIIPRKVWEEFVNLYRKYGKIVGHNVSLIYSGGRDILQRIRSHLDPDDQRIFPKISAKPDMKNGWQLYHPQLAWYICLDYGSPWMKQKPEPTYQEVREKELLELLKGHYTETLEEHLDNAKLIGCDNLIDYLEPLYQQTVEQPEDSQEDQEDQEDQKEMDQGERPKLTDLIDKIYDNAYRKNENDRNLNAYLEKVEPLTETTRMVALETLVQLYDFNQILEILFHCIKSPDFEEQRTRAKEILKNKLKPLAKAEWPSFCDNWEHLLNYRIEKFPDMEFSLNEAMVRVEAWINQNQSDPELVKHLLECSPTS